LLVSGALRLLEAAAGAGALLVVDDLQWADPSSLALLGSVLARLPRLRRCSPSGPTSCLPRCSPSCTARATVLSGSLLGALDEPAIARLVGDPDLVGAVLLATDRNAVRRRRAAT